MQGNRLGPENALTLPTSHGKLSSFGVCFHVASVHPVERHDLSGRSREGNLQQADTPAEGKGDAMTVALLRYLERKQDERREQGKDEKRVDDIQPLWHDVPPED